MDATEYAKFKVYLDDTYTTSNIDVLVGELRQHAETYYNGESEISDWKYDLKEEKLKYLDPNNPYFGEVGVKPRSDSKVRHRERMLSLDSVKNVPDILEWLQRKPEQDVVLEVKADGVAIDIEYSNGSFYRAVTRGDGDYGDDISRHFINNPSIPQEVQQFKKYGSIHVRGEAILDKVTYNEFFSDKANARNAVSGLINRLDTKDSHHIGFVCYRIITPMALETQEMARTFLTMCGFVCVPGFIVHSLSGVEQVCKDIIEMRDIYAFDIDGIVIKMNSMRSQEKLGDGTHAPKWAVVLKFLAKGGDTKLVDVISQVGRTGRITPVAIVEPITIDGVEITRITLHNYARVAKLGLKKSDTVYVIRANDVIPRLEDNKDKNDISTEFEAPIECPICSSSIKSVGEEHFCKNPDCPAQSFGLIKSYIKINRILGIGDETINAMISTGLVSSPADLYTLTPNVLEGLPLGAGIVGWKRADSILAEIRKSKEQKLSRFIQGLGIKLIGENTSKDLAASLKTLDAFEHVVNDSFSTTSLYTIEGVGDETIKSIDNDRDRILLLILALKDHVTVIPDEVKAQMDKPVMTKERGSFNGMTFSITGTLTLPRKEFESLIDEYGGIFHKSPKSTTQVLITGANPGGDKLKKAEKFNLSKITEPEFMSALGSPELINAIVAGRDNAVD